MVIFDIKPISIHGGSIRFYAAKKDSRYGRDTSFRVDVLRKQELELGYDKSAIYKNFASRVAARKKTLMTLLHKLKNDGQTVAGYGASGRANTIIQYCGITDKHLDFIIDDAPAKQGLYTPGAHLQIRSSQALNKVRPDYILLFAWAFYKEIAAKNEDYLRSGGRIIVPIPDVRILKYPFDGEDL